MITCSWSVIRDGLENDMYKAKVKVKWSLRSRPRPVTIKYKVKESSSSSSSQRFLEWPKQQRHHEDHYSQSRYRQYQSVL